MIKKYLQFISESIKEDIEEETLWKLSEDDITDYMLEITDAGYSVSVEFGFSEKVKQESNDVIELIKKLADLHLAGILTDDEFSEKKAELLSKI